MSPGQRKWSAALLLLALGAAALAACAPVHKPKARRPSPFTVAPPPGPAAATAAPGTPAAPVQVALQAALLDPVSNDPIEPGGLLTPGETYRLDVARVEDGRIAATLISGTLNPAQLLVVGQGLTYQVGTRTVVADARPPGDPDWRFSLTVSLREGGATPVTLQFAPDIAPIYGPAPENVAGLTFSLSGQGPEGNLLPGGAAPFVLVVKDRRGREFSSDQPTLRDALARRIRVMSDTVRFDPAAWTVSLPRNGVKMGQTSFAITVEYGGPGGVQATRRFPVDYTRIYGPEPRDVKSVDVRILGLNANDTLDPGKEIPFTVSAVDVRGRRFSTGKDDGFPLPWARLQIHADLLRVDTQAGTLTAEPDLVKVAGKNYRLTVSYGGVKALTTTYVIKPALYAWYRDRTLGTGELRFMGGAGQPGAAGENGKPGRDARHSATGEPTAGEPGAPGTAGGAGQRGPDVIVAATLARTFDNLVDYLFIEVSVAGKRTYYLRKPQDGPLKIISLGGPGGQGGPGGAGGDGGTGAAGGNGADGGAGGNGGPGGVGGDGGNIQVYLSRPDLQRYFVLESTPGPGGAGGKPGAGGRGGAAGDGNVSGARGLAGRLGQQGLEGPAGAPGRAGQSSVMTGGPAADLNNNPPPEYRRNLFFVNVRVAAERRLLSGSAVGGRAEGAPAAPGASAPRR